MMDKALKNSFYLAGLVLFGLFFPPPQRFGGREKRPEPCSGKPAITSFSAGPMNKKAITISTALLIFVIVTGFFLVSAVLYRLVSGAGEKSAELICRASVVGQQEFRIPGIDRPAFPFLCQIVEKEVKGNKEKIIEEFASLAARCWWQFGNGAYKTTLSSTEGRDVCFVCYDVQVKSIKYNKEDVSFDGLELIQFMEGKAYRPKERANDKYEDYKIRSYLNYIQTDEDGKERGMFLVPQDLIFEKGRIYGIAFMEPHKHFFKAPNFWFFTKRDFDKPPYYSAVYVDYRDRLTKNANCVEKLGVQGE